MDFSFLPSEEIEDMVKSGQTELARRQTQDVFNKELAVFQEKYRSALGIEPIEFLPWEQPEYALDAPGLGDTVAIGTTYYRSLLPCNMFDPETAGYRQVTRNGAPRTWVEPTREHDGYVKGERAILGGITYESLGDKNIMRPNADSDYWAEVVTAE